MSTQPPRGRQPGGTRGGRALVPMGVLLVCVFVVGAANALASPLILAVQTCLGWDCHVTAPYSVPLWSFTIAKPILVLSLVTLSIVLAVIGFYDARVTHDARVAVYARYLKFLPLLTLIVLGIVALFLYPPLH